MEIDQLIWDVKMEINNYYDTKKGDIDHHCQSILCNREKEKLDNSALTEKYLSLKP